MTRQPKVYGGCFFLNGNQVRGIMAGTQVEIAKATNNGLAYIRNYWIETGNVKELEIALKTPGVLFWCSNNHYSDREYKRARVSDMIKW
jgi:hypothetical protein